MRKEDNLHVAVVIATLNEEEGIGPTIAELKHVLCDCNLLVVDGNSIDKTVEVAKNMGADIIFQKGKGKGQALRQGLESIDSKVRYVIFIDADYTYPCEQLPKMIELLDQNPDIGMIIGDRFDDKFHFKAAMTNAFYTGNRMLALAQRFLNGVKLHDPLSGLRIVRWKLLNGWKPKSEGFDVEVEMNYHVERQGYGIMEIPIKYRTRLGEKKLKLRDGFTILKRIMTESFS